MGIPFSPTPGARRASAGAAPARSQGGRGGLGCLSTQGGVPFHLKRGSPRFRPGPYDEDEDEDDNKSPSGIQTVHGHTQPYM